MNHSYYFMKIRVAVVRITVKVSSTQWKAKGKYPLAQQYYFIELTPDEHLRYAKEITWKINEDKHKQKIENSGIYYLRTNLNVKDEVLVWNIYNTIIEIENAFRTLKIDLDLRPLFLPHHLVGLFDNPHHKNTLYMAYIFNLT